MEYSRFVALCFVGPAWQSLGATHRLGQGSHWPVRLVQGVLGDVVLHLQMSFGISTLIHRRGVLGGVVKASLPWLAWPLPLNHVPTSSPQVRLLLF